MNIPNPKALPSSPDPIENIDVARIDQDILSLENVISSWEEQHHQNTAYALKKAIEDINKVAFVRLIRFLKSKGLTSTLKEAMSDEVLYKVLRYHGILQASLNERIEESLESVRPFLQEHKGDVELVNIIPPDTIEVRLLGSCDGCPASTLTLTQGIEKAVKEKCPEITKIKKVSGHKKKNKSGVDYISPFAQNDDKDWEFACHLKEIPEEGIKFTELSGEKILLGRFGDDVVCYQNACAHMGMPFDTAVIKHANITCTYHQFSYDLRTGECLTAPEVQLLTHAVRVKNDKVEINLMNG